MRTRATCCGWVVLLVYVAVGCGRPSLVAPVDRMAGVPNGATLAEVERAAGVHAEHRYTVSAESGAGEELCVSFLVGGGRNGWIGYSYLFLDDMLVKVCQTPEIASGVETSKGGWKLSSWGHVNRQIAAIRSAAPLSGADVEQEVRRIEAAPEFLPAVYLPMRPQRAGRAALSIRTGGSPAEVDAVLGAPLEAVEMEPALHRRLYETPRAEGDGRTAVVGWFRDGRLTLLASGPLAAGGDYVPDVESRGP